MKNKILYLLIFCVLGIHLNAKHFRVMVVTDLNELDSVEFYDKGKVSKITLAKNYISGKFEIPTNNAINFYEKFPEFNTIAKPKPNFTIKFPKNNKNTIVILKSSNNSKTPIDTIIIEEDNKTFPQSSSMIYNIMDKPVLAKLGHMKVKIAPNERKIVKLKNKDEPDAPFNEKVVFAAPREGDIDFFYSTYWYVPKTQKLFCVIAEDKINGTYELNKILVD